MLPWRFSDARSWAATVAMSAMLSPFFRDGSAYVQEGMKIGFVTDYWRLTGSFFGSTRSLAGRPVRTGKPAEEHSPSKKAKSVIRKINEPVASYKEDGAEASENHRRNPHCPEIL